MRDILFRGLTKTKTWMEGWFCGGTCDSPDGDVKQCSVIIDKDTLFWFDVDPDTIGQYTGMVDRKGRKIFEGDIVTMPAYGGGRTKAIVYFKDGKFAVNGSNYHFKDIKPSTMEVIGNIHRNSDLLGGDDV